MRKVCVVTGTRAEYGLLSRLMKAIEESDGLELQIVATGMHLSSEFGLTYRQIEQDGFQIDKKVEMLLSSDSEVGVGKSMGVGMIGFVDALNDLQPDLMVLLGDRFEAFTAASAAMVMRIPIAHLHGGETTEGAIDESIRHAISKMSHLHFTAAEAYRERVIQLGEHPERVFNVGAVGIDNIKSMELLSREVLEEAIGFRLGERNLLVTYHPVTLEEGTARKQFDNLLQALDRLERTHIIFTKSNADAGGRAVNRMIDEDVASRPDTTVAYNSLGQLRYFSVLQYMDGVVGNSSSGLIEVPVFGIGTVNIGDRQKGRLKAESVIDCEPETETIGNAIDRLYSDDFAEVVRSAKNPYGDGEAVTRIREIIEEFDLSDLLKKKFHDFN